MDYITEAEAREKAANVVPAPCFHDDVQERVFITGNAHNDGSLRDPEPYVMYQAHGIRKCRKCGAVAVGTGYETTSCDPGSNPIREWAMLDEWLNQ